MNSKTLNSALFELPSGVSPEDHSERVDKFIGFEVVSIESELSLKYKGYHGRIDELKSKKIQYANCETWIGLHPQTLLTPYHEIFEFLSILKEYSIETIVDLGAGYGRVGLVMQAILPDTKFIGYEIVKSRVIEGNRVFQNFNLSNCSLHSQNILESNFKIPKANVYFIYDFSDPHDLKVILREISERMITDKFFLIARGKGIRSLIQHKFPEFHVCFDPIHSENWSIYSSFTDLKLKS